MEIFELINHYTRYNVWANESLANYFKQEMKPDDFIKPMGSSFSSVEDTTLHIWGAQEIWLTRLEGLSNPAFPSFDERGQMKLVLEALMISSRTFETFVRAAGSDLLTATFDYQNMAGIPFKNKGWEMVHHCMNHSTFHRGQLITMARQMGYDNLPATDQIKFMRV